MHTVFDDDGMRVLRVTDMNKRFHPTTGAELPTRSVNDDIVHFTAIAEYYGLDPRDVWPLVHSQAMGPRVPYNTDETVPGDRHIRRWNIVKDKNTGEPLHSEEKIIQVKTHWDGNKDTREPIVDSVDDGMYVRLKDVKRYAKAHGWSKGGGLPAKTGRTPAGIDTDAKLDKLIDLITLMVAKQVLPVTADPAAAEPAPKQRSLKARANDAWIAAGKPESAADFKAEWIERNAE